MKVDHDTRIEFIKAQLEFKSNVLQVYLSLWQLQGGLSLCKSSNRQNPDPENEKQTM